MEMESMHQLSHSNICSRITFLSPFKISIRIILQHVETKSSQFLCMNIPSFDFFIGGHHHSLIKTIELLPWETTIWKSCQVSLMRMYDLREIFWMKRDSVLVCLCNGGVHINHLGWLDPTSISVFHSIKCFLEYVVWPLWNPVLFTQLRVSNLHFPYLKVVNPFLQLIFGDVFSLVECSCSFILNS